MTTGFDIYRIEGCNYIGSSTDLEKRRKSHIKDCFNSNHKNYNLKIYKFIRDNNIEIKLISIFRRRRNVDYLKKTMRLVEQFYIDKYNSINDGLNTINSYTNKKKYRKKYLLKNRESIKLRNKQYFSNPINIEKKKQYRLKNKGRRKEYFKKYHLDNREKRRLHNKLYTRKYTLINRDELNRKKRAKLICNICGANTTYNSKTRHQKTTKKCLKIAREKAAMEVEI